LEEKTSYDFNKKEKLKSRKLIEQLFRSKGAFLVFPVKVVYMTVDEPLDFPIKIGVSASKKNFKSAVDRNRIKRLLKESYRLNKYPLHQYIKDSGKQVAVFFMFIDKVLPENELFQRKMPVVIDKLIKALNETSTPAS
jgi:ribonuclease P protein component